MAAINNNNVPKAKERSYEELKLSSLYYRGVYQRGLFNVEEAAVDIHNKLIDLNAQHRKGEITDEDYATKKKELEEAGYYFNSKIADDYFTDEGFERDDEDRIISMDGEPVRKLDLESINKNVQKLRTLLAKEENAEFADLSYKELYHAGIYKYDSFTVDEADIDCRNRLIDVYVAGLEEDISEVSYYKEKEMLEEAKRFLDEEVANLHFLVGDCKIDSSGRYTEIRGESVKSIDTEEIRKEFMAVRDMQLAAQESETATGTTGK